MLVSVLGPVEVRVDGTRKGVAGARVRRLLVRLAVDAPNAVPARDLVDAVWFDDEPRNVTNALQALVSRLRRALGSADAVEQIGSGYRLSGCDTDIQLFERLCRTGRDLLATGDLRTAATVLGEAGTLWSGEALAAADSADYAIGPAVRLEEQRIEAICDRIDAQLQLGEAARVVAELEELTSLLPLRERLTAQLMKALASTGRPAEALGVYASLRLRLADELGSDPSAELQALHLALLRGEQPVAHHGSTERVAPAREPLRSHRTSFVGRSGELRRIHELVSAGRLVTVVGPGGAGKTRLAIEAARTWPVPPGWDGHHLIELAPILEPANLASAFLTALGIRESRQSDDPTDRPLTRDSLTRLIATLRESSCLLVVDNCEHLLDGVADLLDRLLAACPEVRVLATSREPIGIDGEALCAVPPLALPSPGVGPDDALSFPSVQLFADRAGAVSGDFKVDADTVDHVVEIVRRLDGLPLAIELAAARLRVLPVGEVARRLSDRFRLLTGGNRTAVPRHRTLRAVVEWSWELLGAAERCLVERLAVFPAGASVPAAVSVCTGDPVSAVQVPELLDSLVDKSLLVVEAGGGVRYRMLETIREYGVERLGERGELADIRQAHARFFAGVTATSRLRLHGPDQLEAAATLDRESGNIVAALRFLGDSGQVDAALELVTDMCWYWMLCNEHAEATSWLSFVVGLPAAEADEGLRVLAEAGLLLNEMASATASAAHAEQEWSALAAEVSRRLNEAVVPARFQPTRMVLGVALNLFAEDERATDAALEEALGSDDPWIRAVGLAFRAAVAENRGDADLMRADGERAVQSFRDLGDRWGMATALSATANSELLAGNLDGAAARYEEAAELSMQFGARSDGGFIRVRLAGVRMRQGRLDEARALLDEFVDAPGIPADLGAMFGRSLLAELAWVEGDLPRMRVDRDRVAADLAALDLSLPIGAHGRAIALASIVKLYAVDGDVRLARRYLADAIPAGRGTRDRPVMSAVAVSGSVVAVADGLPDLAAETLGAAAVLRGGDDPLDPTVRLLTESLTAELGPERFSECYQRGRALSSEQAEGWLDRVAALSDP